MTDDPCEAICAAVVTSLNNAQSPIEQSPFKPLAFAAAVPENIQAEAERETYEFRVFISPFGEIEEKTGRGGEVTVTYSLTLMVVAQLTPQFTRKLLNSLVYTIRAYLRGRRMNGKYVYSGAETITKNDPLLLGKMQYQSITRLNFTGTEGQVSGG